MTSPSSQKPLRLVMAGGGTGGHVFPGISILEALQDMHPVEVLWIGTGRPVEKAALADRPWAYRVLEVKPLQGVGLGRAALAMMQLPVPVTRAVAWLANFRPDLVFGLGGYVSGPVLLAARLLRIPTGLHEQNVVPGLANRLAARFAQSVFVSFEETLSWFPKSRARLGGMPIRKSLLAAQEPPKPPSSSTRILVLGGSQGARGINRLVSSAASLLWQSGIPVEILHQTGAADADTIQSTYDKAEVPARVHPFIVDMSEAYAWADLVISRSGAGTLAELAALGKPSILIPFPSAAGNHQEANARTFAETKAAILCREEDIGAVRLATEIQNLVETPGALERMGHAAARLGRPYAAMDIARHLLTMMHKPVPAHEAQGRHQKIAL